jgi:uncharacterized membrane protein
MKKFFKTVVILTGIALMAAAVIKELRKPRGQRDWHGRLGGVIPYELRPPTPHRVKDAMWNPHDDRVLTDTAFGVGWAVNMAEVKNRMSKQNGEVVAA